MLNVGPPKLLSKECNCQSHKLLSIEYCVSWKSDFHPFSLLCLEYLIQLLSVVDEGFEEGLIPR